MRNATAGSATQPNTIHDGIAKSPSCTSKPRCWYHRRATEHMARCSCLSDATAPQKLQGCNSCANRTHTHIHAHRPHIFHLRDAGSRQGGARRKTAHVLRHSRQEHRVCQVSVQAFPWPLEGGTLACSRGRKPETRRMRARNARMKVASRVLPSRPQSSRQTPLTRKLTATPRCQSSTMFHPAGPAKLGRPELTTSEEHMASTQDWDRQRIMRPTSEQAEREARACTPDTSRPAMIAAEVHPPVFGDTLMGGAPRLAFRAVKSQNQPGHPRDRRVDSIERVTTHVPTGASPTEYREDLRAKPGKPKRRRDCFGEQMGLGSPETRPGRSNPVLR